MLINSSNIELNSSIKVILQYIAANFSQRLPTSENWAPYFSGVSSNELGFVLMPMICVAVNAVILA